MNPSETAALGERLEAVRGRLAGAARIAGRKPEDVRLIAVSKLHPVEAILAAYGFGQRVFGENYVQEALAKQEALPDLDVEWHCIGHVQTNKAKDVTGRFALIHTVDNLKFAETLARRLPEDIPVQRVLLQVNIGNEPQKAGVDEHDLPSLAEAVLALPRLEVRGLMCLPPFFDDGEAARPYFARLRELRDDLESRKGKVQSVEKWSMTIHRLFSKDPNDEEENVTQNIYVFRFILFCIIVYSFEMLLNSVDIFIVDKTIFTRGYVTGCLFAAVYVLILLHLGLEHPLTKYVSITAVSLIIMAASVSLTYHMIIIIMMPIIIAGMYTSKQRSIYTFVLTVLSIIISTYAGYYYGVCDANMVLLTTTSMNHLVENGTFLLNQVNENPGVTLALYYVLPRCLMAMSFVYVSNIVNQVI